MAKKHYVVWGRVGLIYFSWLLIVLFTSLIIAYEGTSSFNWPAIGCGILFVLLAVYTYVNSYWSK
ncbi:acyltransferase, partial [Lactobacillus sp. XV13L]|nr:acyltransferase [Lactobacillus sp. XV13L]